jgi:dehydrogenase/reductase SDR family protein 12
MVTGANSGIGKACAMAYAKAGGRVYLVCRNRDRANAAQAEIQAATGNKVRLVFVQPLTA